MYSKAERLRAIELYFKFGRKIASVIRELGYPTDATSGDGYRHGKPAVAISVACPAKSAALMRRNRPPSTITLRTAAALPITRRTLVYPFGALLIRWIDELHPGWRRIHTSVQNASAPFKPEIKLQAVRDLCTRTIPAKKIAQDVGVSRQVLYKWKNGAIGDETYQFMRKNNAPSLIQERDALREELARLTQAIKRQQLELDILKKEEEIIKKTRASASAP